MNENQTLTSSDDPDQTVLIVDSDDAQIVAEPALPSPATTVERTIRLPGCGLNPLVHAANSLLGLVGPIRGTISHPNVSTLRQQLVNAIKQFETDAKDANVRWETIAVARYALCTFLDEMISSTKWGGGGVWAHSSLLVTFHQEASGGENFFRILHKLAQDPEKNLDVLELMYLCLALGFEGRYGVIEGGQARLTTLRERLQRLIKSRRGSIDHDLSPRWQGVNARCTTSIRRFPIWIAAVFAGVSLLVLYLWLSFSLNRLTAPVSARLQRMQVSGHVATAPVAVAVAVQSAQGLVKLLNADIERGLVSVTETADRSTITLHGGGVFATGSARVGERYVPLLTRIGDALDQVAGKVLVIGHTDNVGRREESRFASNWTLSKARADAVRTLLATRGAASEGSDRFIADGLGDIEPLVPNDSPANRARNRRVDIVVLRPVGAS